MALLLSWWALDVLVAVFVLLLSLYLYATRNFSYWCKKGVTAVPNPWPIAGNLKNTLLFRQGVGEELRDVYKKYKGLPYVGLYSFDQPMLLVRDLDLVKNVLQKDFVHFTDKGFRANKNDPLFYHTLFSRPGQQWKTLRTKLTPAFTTGKMKKIFVLVEEKAAQMDHYFDSDAPVNIKDALAKFTTDVVASVGFGIKTDSLHNSEDEFRHFLKNVFYSSPLKAIQTVAQFCRVPLMQLMGVTIVDSQVNTFIRDAIWSTVKYRKDTGSKRDDFLDLLIEIKEKGSIQDEEWKTPNEKPTTNILEGDAFVSQAFTFLTAGFETSASTMTYCLYHLALDQNIQHQLRIEIKEAHLRHGGKMSYEAVYDLPYLDMVLAETLRLYPIMPFLDRVCVKKYQIPGTTMVVDEGVNVFISLLGIHLDPDIYPHPEKFNPERFSEKNKQARHKCAHMPFGEGPRTCIGMRFGLMQAKVGLAHILMNYEVEPCSTTPKEVLFDPHSFLLKPMGDLPLRFSRVQN